MRHFTPLALKKRSSKRSFTLHSRVSKTIPDCSMHQFKNGCILTQSWRLNGSDFQGAQAAEEWICEILDHNNKWVGSMQLDRSMLHGCFWQTHKEEIKVPLRCFSKSSSKGKKGKILPKKEIETNAFQLFLKADPQVAILEL